MRFAKWQRVVSPLLILTFVSATVQTVGAQSAVPPQGQTPAASQQTMAVGMLEGETLAGSQRTGGKLAAGLGLGVLTGVIGTGIGFFVIGPDPMTPEALKRMENKSSEYQLGFRSGWDKKTQSKKRNSFLAGGLLGTAAFVAVLLSARSSSNPY